ncbi:ZIP-like iron-zinc transporter [Gymnopilus junonius]|uniref:ZIP-like iron-zinc transporter n=1 Tax=Gymnopilus junonius TaxID=109634 RepID=A0A9P5N8T3_GYMJU|nr:ZIP-like iron-zinc transporter [Gymnopilus junonius]
MSDDTNCGDGGGADTFAGLRIGSVFIILATSMTGALFPILAKRTTWLTVPKSVFDFAKYFGSGVIIATAFIHLLASGVTELNSPCLDPAWLIYPYPLALSMLAIFAIFIVELIAFRWGTAKLAAMGKSHDPHGHSFGHAAHGPEDNHDAIKEEKVSNDIETASVSDDDKDWSDALGQMIGVAILEFGVLLHSVLIGLTLAVDPDFKVLFVVIIFHQTFEGLGIGSRLAVLDLPKRYNWLIMFGGVLYGITTPIGIAAGLGIKSTYNPNGTKASIVSGVMDSLSSGILIYTGLVELLAHEFLFNKEMNRASNGRLAYALTCMIAGCGIMALLGRWA